MIWFNISVPESIIGPDGGPLWADTKPESMQAARRHNAKRGTILLQ